LTFITEPEKKLDARKTSIDCYK